MAREIERKFLVDPKGAEVKAILAGPGTRIRQGYIASSARGVVRVRIKGETGLLTVKGATEGFSRDEFEYEIPLADAEAMLSGLCGKIVDKTRWTHPLPCGHTLELDVFADIDLALAEVEMDREDAQVDLPDWLGREVSTDPAYFHNTIAERL